MTSIPGYLLSDRSRLDATLRSLLRYRVVCFCGLPATGKSLLVQQLALLGTALWRDVSLLQWDVARPALQACDAAAAYPDVDGITPPPIIRATGLWARDAVAAWNTSAGPDALLLIEAPLIGGRFVELVTHLDDAAEPLLADPWRSRYELLVPSPKARALIEAERAAHHATPRHALEREDASPEILRQMWRDLLADCRARGIGVPQEVAQAASFEPELYVAYYQLVARARGLELIHVDELANAGIASVYETPGVALLPTLTEAEAAIRRAEAGIDSG